jgi:2-dehydro-3-deoxy-D-arabinonate dehydratase
MDLTRHDTSAGPRWAADGKFLASSFTLSGYLSAAAPEEYLGSRLTEEKASGHVLSPAEESQEIWASGVTYLSSRLAREAESQVADVYQLVYNAARPELFFKATGWRSKGPGNPIRIREDSGWNVPEPELTLVIHRSGRIMGYTIGNDVSSRSIEGENPLYLPQAKVYNGSCALGPAIRLCAVEDMADLPIRVEIRRKAVEVFSGETRSSQIKRPLEELAEYLFRELSFPDGAFLMTGTGIVPTEEFTLQKDDLVRICIDDLTLENRVA